MYARITKYQCDPSRLEEIIAKTDEIKAQVKAISGVVDIYSAWRADGSAITTAIYENQAAADASTAQVQAIWASLVDLLVGAPEVETFENVEHMTG